MEGFFIFVVLLLYGLMGKKSETVMAKPELLLLLLYLKSFPRPWRYWGTQEQLHEVSNRNALGLAWLCSVEEFLFPCFGLPC